MNNIVFQKDYITYLTESVTAINTGEIEFKLNDTPASNIGFLVIEKGVVGKEESLFYHRRLGNSVFVYGVNRDSATTHDINSTVLLVNSIDALTYLTDNTFEQMYIYKVSTEDVFITGGMFYIENSTVTIENLKTADNIVGKSLIATGYNYITIKDGDYHISATLDLKDYLIGTILTSGGVITDINRIKVMPISGGVMTTADKTKLDGIEAGAEVNVQADYTNTDVNSDAYILNKPANLVQDANYVQTEQSYTTADKNKLAGIEAGAEVNVQADYTEVDVNSDSYIKNKPLNLVQDATYVKTDENYTTAEQTKLAGIDTSLYIENVLAGSGVTVNRVGADVTVTSSLLGGNTTYSQLGAIRPTLYDGGIEGEEEWYRYIELRAPGMAGYWTEIDVPYKAVDITRIRTFCKNLNNAGDVVLQTLIRAIDYNGQVQIDIQSVPYKATIGTGDTFFDLGPLSTDGLVVNSNTAKLYIKIYRRSDYDGVEDTVNGAIKVDSLKLDFTAPTTEELNSILNGVVDPTTEGIEGDFYINTVTNTIFGPKTSGAWGVGTSLIGATGDPGADGIDGIDGIDGRSIVSIIRTTGTGAPGTIDTYTINYSIAPLTSTFDVYNGADGVGAGDMLKAENLSGLVNYVTARSNLGLGNVDNTSDLSKPISTATQTEIDTKEDSFTKNTGFNKNLGTIAGTVSEGNHDHTGIYEPVITKNTGFNKNLGTTAGTVSEGNHTHSAYSLTSHNHTGVYEPAFAKNTGFNKNFGTVAGTVLEGRAFGSIAEKTYWNGTQADYDAIATKDTNTIYFINE